MRVGKPKSCTAKKNACSAQLDADIATARQRAAKLPLIADNLTGVILTRAEHESSKNAGDDAEGRKQCHLRSKAGRGTVASRVPRFAMKRAEKR